ncbi:hypothetical protein HY570_03075, partial [Candidatus Micrarchaeota archaeon]|nr:hypothetical protein [Candidatus Micrarchaeota archaeon]
PEVFFTLFKIPKHERKGVSDCLTFCGLVVTVQILLKGYRGEDVARAAILIKNGIDESELSVLMQLKQIQINDLVWAANRAKEMRSPTAIVITSLAISLKQWGQGAVTAWREGIRPSLEDPLDELFYTASKICMLESYNGPRFLRKITSTYADSQEKKEILLLADRFGIIEVSKALDSGLNGADLLAHLEVEQAERSRRQRQRDGRGTVGSAIRKLNIYLEKLEEVSPELARMIRDRANRTLY